MSSQIAFLQMTCPKMSAKVWQAHILNVAMYGELPVVLEMIAISGVTITFQAEYCYIFFFISLHYPKLRKNDCWSFYKKI